MSLLTTLAVVVALVVVLWLAWIAWPFWLVRRFGSIVHPELVALCAIAVGTLAGYLLGAAAIAAALVALL